MKKIICVLAAAALALALAGCCKSIFGGKKGETRGPNGSLATEAPAAGVAGKYAGAGTNADGSAYKCDVDVTPAGKIYKVVWYFDGQPGYEGTGILKGKTFVVGFANQQGYGVVAYAVNADGSLDGTWAGKGATKAGTEKLTKK